MPAGRPTDYRTEYAEQAYHQCLLGATDKDLAAAFDVSEQTINAWKKQFPEFLESLKRGKEIADQKVAEKLHERATGYEWTEEQAIKVKCGKDEERVEIVQVTRRVPPDPVSAIFWLKNRKSDKWRDKQEHEVNHKFEPLVVNVNGGSGTPPETV